MRIDMHAHYIPQFFVDEATENPDRYGAMVENGPQGRRLRHKQGFGYPIPDTFITGAAMIDAMNRIGLDARIVSLNPSLMYFEDKAMQVGFIRRANDYAAALCKANPGRLWAMAAVPLPNVEESVEELTRCRSLGMVGIEIPCNIAGRQLDDPLFRPFFAKAAELDLPVFLHPVYMGPKPGLEDYYFVNSIGNPYDTTLAAARLLHCGIFAELPNLKIVLAHGGGFFPYQRGRFEHAWQVRTEPKMRITQPPKSFSDNLYFDTITHDPVALRYLIEAYGEEKVLMGSDFPFDMGPADVVSDVVQAQLATTTLRRIQGGNAISLFHLK